MNLAKTCFKMLHFMPVAATPAIIMQAPAMLVILMVSPRNNIESRIVKIGERYCMTFANAISIRATPSYQAQYPIAVGNMMKYNVTLQSIGDLGIITPSRKNGYTSIV